jgi:hypothetical protein
MNVCREQKPDNEMSCLSPTFGSFDNPAKFAEVRYEDGNDTTLPQVSIESIRDKGDNVVKLNVKNGSASSASLKAIVTVAQNGTQFFTKTESFVLAEHSEHRFTIPYEVKPGEQKLDITINHQNGDKMVYHNSISFSHKDNKNVETRVWQIERPLYRELFSEEPAGLAKEGAVIWFQSRNYETLRPFAMQYGFRYVLTEEYDYFARHNLHPFISSIILSPNLWAAEKEKIYDYDREYKVREVLYIDCKDVNTPKIDGSPFLLDPVCTEKALQIMKGVLDKHADAFWAVSVGDEAHEDQSGIGIAFFETMRDNYPYIVQVDNEVKKMFGGGIYGIPQSKTDANPYRRIAYDRWLNAKLAEFMAKVYAIVKQSHPELYIISYNPIAYANPFDFSLWKNKCDILLHQLYPRQNADRADMGYITKLITDISGVREVWPCGHVERYSAEFAPEETLELVSQVFRNGATGITYYPLDTTGRYAGGRKYLQTDYYGSPENWETVMNLIQESGRMNRLKFPQPDSAILYSCDNQSALPFTKEIDRNEYAYTLLGPNAGSWFKFIDDNQIVRNQIDLSQFKVIYIPAAKYERSEVADALIKYVSNGGTVVCGDPEVFSFDVLGKDISGKRKELFGIEEIREEKANVIIYNNVKLPVYNTVYAITPPPVDEVQAVFDNGSPAIISHSVGKGTAIYFASNPFALKTLSDMAWKDFFKSFQRKLKLSVDQDIWRFKFPKELVASIPLPKEKCLTNNSSVWRKYEQLDICNLDTNGVYSYSVMPDEVTDSADGNIPFSAGKLTNRRLAPSSGNVDSGLSPLSNWIVSYKKAEKFAITFDFKKNYEIKQVRIIYSGQLPEITLAASADGTNWKTLDVSYPKQSFSEDVFDCILKGEFGRNRYVRVMFGERDLGKSLTLAELEIWGNNCE